MEAWLKIMRNEGIIVVPVKCKIRQCIQLLDHSSDDYTLPMTTIIGVINLIIKPTSNFELHRRPHHESYRKDANYFCQTCITYSNIMSWACIWLGD